MRSLYEIDANLADVMAQAVAQAEENNGEISEHLCILLDAVEVERELKIGNICRFIKSLNAEADMVKAEEVNLAKRRQGVAGKAESLKRYLAGFMTEGEKFSDENSKVSWRKSSSIFIDESFAFDEAPDGWVKTTQSWDKTAIKNDIKKGTAVVGNAKIVEKQNIQIR